MKIAGLGQLRKYDQLKQDIFNASRNGGTLKPRPQPFKHLFKAIKSVSLPIFGALMGAGFYVFRNYQVERSWFESKIDIKRQLRKAKVQALVYYFRRPNVSQSEAIDLYLTRVKLLAEKLSPYGSSTVTAPQKILQYQKIERLSTPLFSSGIRQYTKKYDRQGNLVEHRTQTAFRLFHLIPFGRTSKTVILEPYFSISKIHGNNRSNEYNIVDKVDSIQFWLYWITSISPRGMIKEKFTWEEQREKALRCQNQIRALLDVIPDSLKTTSS